MKIVERVEREVQFSVEDMAFMAHMVEFLTELIQPLKDGYSNFVYQDCESDCDPSYYSITSKKSFEDVIRCLTTASESGMLEVDD